MATRALAPQWIDAFEASDHEAKRRLLQMLVRDWLSGINSHNAFVHLATGFLLPHAALLELLEDASTSAARRTIIEDESAEALSTALRSPAWQHAASMAIDSYLKTYPHGAAGLTARLDAALAARAGSIHIVTGLERLAEVSSTARRVVIPVLLDGLKASLLSARPSFEHTSRVMADLAWIARLGASSPYEAALASAWPATHDG